MTAAEIAARRIREHLATKAPTPCDPTFMDAEDQWWQVRYWRELGLARHDTGPHGKASKVERRRHWAHDLLPGAYPTLDALLVTLDAAAVEAAAREAQP